MSHSNRRPLAPHVQRTIAAVQARPAPAGRTVAPHVQRAIRAGMHNAPSPVGGATHPTHSVAVQPAAREKHEQSFNYAVVPDLGLKAYYSHVRLRTKLFFVLLFRVLRLCNEYGVDLSTRSLAFTDKASVQTGSGFRKLPLEKDVQGSGSYDAAHFANTSLEPSFFSGLKLKESDQKLVEHLYMLSSSTSMQFQTSNVSSDKVIDGMQTRYKNLILTKISKVDEGTIKVAIQDYLGDLQADLKSKSPTPGTGLKNDSYAVALQSVSDQLSDVGSLVQDVLQEL